MPIQTTPGLKLVNGYWHYSIQVGGIRKHGSTKTKDYDIALTVVAQKRAELGVLPVVASPVKTLRDLFIEWRDIHTPIVSESYMCSSESRYTKWIAPAIGNLPINQIKADAVLSVCNAMLAAGQAPRTANNAIILLKTLVRYALRMEYIDRIPFTVKLLRIQQKPRPVLPIDLVARFFEVADTVARNPQVGVMFRVLVALGLREGEMLGMRWEWFDHDHKTYTVGKAKGKEARVLPVPDWLWDSIHKLPKHSEWVFPTLFSLPHPSRYLHKYLDKITNKLSLPHMSQHRLRATFATLHAEAGTPIPDIQGMLGHKAITTTMVYIESSLDARRRAQDVLSNKLGMAKKRAGD